MKVFVWRCLALLVTAPACTLLQPLDTAAPDSAAGTTSSGGSGEHGGTSAKGGSTSQAGGAGGASADGGTGGGVAPRGGAGGGLSEAGQGGRAPARGGAGGAPACSAPGYSCAAAADCCQTGKTIPTAFGASCITDDYLCHANCQSENDCFSKCCVTVDFTTVYGVCADAAFCM